MKAHIPGWYWWADRADRFRSFTLGRLEEVISEVDIRNVGQNASGDRKWDLLLLLVAGIKERSGGYDAKCQCRKRGDHELLG
ncbi:MAG: hypothetical protein V3T77_09215, partial [Planctomycetota bacterium]